MMENKLPIKALEMEYAALSRSSSYGQVVGFAAIATQYLCMMYGRELPPSALIGY